MPSNNTNPTRRRSTRIATPMKKEGSIQKAKKSRHTPVKEKEIPPAAKILELIFSDDLDTELIQDITRLKRSGRSSRRCSLKPNLDVLQEDSMEEDDNDLEALAVSFKVLKKLVGIFPPLLQLRI